MSSKYICVASHVNYMVLHVSYMLTSHGVKKNLISSEEMSFKHIEPF